MDNWPTREEYQRAMRDWKVTLLDPALRAGNLLRDPAGNPIAREGAGLYVCVFQIGEDWMVRCFRSDPTAHTQPPPDIERRYQAIVKFYEQHKQQLSALVPVAYLPNGIRVQQRTIPIVKMKYLSGATTLGEYVLKHRDNQAAITSLAAAWQRMIAEMETARIAHGDLDLTNVMVESGMSLQLRLVDYDNMYVPDLIGLPQREGGHPPFQHPWIPSRRYDETMDRFSALSISISLLALAHDPTLYAECQADESTRLLLDVQDYRDYAHTSGRIANLRKRVASLAPYLEALTTSLHDRVMPPPLSEILTRYAGAIPGRASPKVVATGAPQAPIIRNIGAHPQGTTNQPSGGGTVYPQLRQTPPPPLNPFPSSPPRQNDNRVGSILTAIAIIISILIVLGILAANSH